MLTIYFPSDDPERLGITPNLINPGMGIAWETVTKPFLLEENHPKQLQKSGPK
jgi:hypothetical protein